MTYEGGRRKPKAAERSKVILKTNTRALVEAEIIVTMFDKAISSGTTERALRSRLRDRLPHHERELTSAQIAIACSDYGRARESWDALKTREGMTLVWTNPR